MQTSAIERLINDISKLPGLGRKSAERIALYLLKNKKKCLSPLINTLHESHDKIIECSSCGNIDLTDPCNICSNNKRDNTTICIVEDVSDFLRTPINANTTPNKAQVEKIINRKEGEIERRIGHAWRSKKITREVHDLPLLYTFGWGTPIFLQHRNIYELSSSDGDKIEIWQGASATWEDILNNEQWYDIEYEYGIYSRGLPTKVKSKRFKFAQSTIYEAPIFKDSEGETNFSLLINFPKKKRFLIGSIMGMAFLSLLFILVIVASYSGAIYQLIRQKQISEIKSDFINNMTHEFKTPIATINLAVEAIRNEK